MPQSSSIMAGKPRRAEGVRYEGYGPAGTAVLVDCVSADHRNTRQALRQAFERHGGRLGADGAVNYLFRRVGRICYPPGSDAAELKRAAHLAGAEEVLVYADASVAVLVDPAELAVAQAALTRDGFSPATAQVTEYAAATLRLTGAAAEAMRRFLDALHALADVRAVYSNAELAECRAAPA